LPVKNSPHIELQKELQLQKNKDLENGRKLYIFCRNFSENLTFFQHLKNYKDFENKKVNKFLKLSYALKCLILSNVSMKFFLSM